MFNFNNKNICKLQQNTSLFEISNIENSLKENQYLLNSIINEYKIEIDENIQEKIFKANNKCIYFIYNYLKKIEEEVGILKVIEIGYEEEKNLAIFACVLVMKDFILNSCCNDRILIIIDTSIDNVDKCITNIIYDMNLLHRLLDDKYHHFWKETLHNHNKIVQDVNNYLINIMFKMKFRFIRNNPFLGVISFIRNESFTDTTSLEELMKNNTSHMYVESINQTILNIKYIYNDLILFIFDKTLETLDTKIVN